MKRLLIVMFAALCAAVSGCASNRPPAEKDDFEFPTKDVGSRPTTQPVNKFGCRELPDIIQWSAFPYSPRAGEQWLEEARTRFANPVIFICHGQSEWGVDQWGETTKTWWVYPDKPRRKQSANEVVRTLKNMYPNRDVVMVVCNPHGHKPVMAGVWIALHDVWVVPDFYTMMAPGLSHREIYPGVDAVGSIHEMIEGQKK